MCNVIRLVLLFCLTSFLSTGQVNITHFNKIDEFNGVAISAIKQDSLGFLWLGTQDGLIRYEGNNFSKLRFSSNYKNLIRANGIKDILFLNGHEMALATNGGGLTKLDLKRMAAIHSDEELGNFITKCINIENKNLICESDKGLFRVSGDFKIKPFEFSSYVRLLEYKDYQLYLGQESDLLVVNPVSGQVTQKLKFDGAIKNMLLFDKGYLIFTNEGLYKVTDNHIIKKISDNGELLGGIDYSEKSLLLFSQKKLFFLDKSDSSFLELKTNLEMDKQVITTVFKDINKNLWLGTESGLYRHTILSESFYELKVKGSQYKTLLKTNNKIYIGNNIGLFVIENNKIQKQLLNNINVKAIKSINGKVWIGGSNGEVFILNDVDYSYKHFYLTGKEKEGQAIFDFEKDSNGRIWISTWQGLFIFDQDNNILKIVDKNIRLQKILDSYIDNNDRLWLATADEGIIRLDSVSNVIPRPNRFNFKNFKYSPQNQNSVSSNVIFTIEQDYQDVIWFGTDNGMVTFDEKNEQFKRFNVNGEIFDKKVMKILCDQSGKIWISTLNDGIYKYIPEENKLYNYTSKLGLISNAFYLGSGFHDLKSNYVYFSSNQGIQVVDTKKTNTFRSKKNPVLTRIEINAPDSLKIHPFQASYLNSMEFEYHFNDIVFGFSTLDYMYPFDLKFNFQLDKNTWRFTDTDKMYFTNLGLGNHQLKVKKANDDFVNTSTNENKFLNFKFRIVPPWYRTSFAYSMYVLITGIFIFLLIRSIINKKTATERAKTIEIIDAQKSKLYANISHEIRTPLTIINGLTKELEETEDFTNKLKAVSSISTSSNYLLNLVNQMLELVSLDANQAKVNFKNGDAINFVQDCVSLYKTLAFSKGIQLIFKSDLDHFFMDIDDDKLQKIINNLLSNAIKFTPQKGTVTVIATSEADRFIIKINDSGRGIAKEDLPLIFDRYYQTFDKDKNLGSGIGMAITKELVNLLEGDISVKSELGEGTEFTISLPISNKSSESTLKLFKPFLQNSKSLEEFKDSKNTTKENKILIVEDNQEILDYLINLFESNYSVTAVKNGKKALKALNKTNFEIVVSDLEMPEMNGLDFCCKLKASVDTSHIPFVVLSAHAESKYKIEAYGKGVDAYLTKPFDKNELLALIDSLIIRRKKQIAYFNELLDLKPKVKETLNLNEIDIDLIKRLQTFILEHNQGFSIEDLTIHLGVSRTQLHRKVKSLTGLSVTNYMNKIRIEKAKSYLLNTELNINEIAFEVGYEDPAYFSRVFKKITTLSPDIFRKNNKNNS